MGLLDFGCLFYENQAWFQSLQKSPENTKYFSTRQLYRLFYPLGRHTTLFFTMKSSLEKDMGCSKN